MDIFAHMLWVLILFYSYDKLWLALVFSILPDIITFGPNFAYTVIARKFPKENWKDPEAALRFIPRYVFTLYDITHSLAVFSAVFLLAWLLTGLLPLYLFAWLLHILIDIPTHSKRFFPVKLFYPLSGFSFDGITWGTKRFMIANYSLIGAALVFRFLIMA